MCKKYIHIEPQDVKQWDEAVMRRILATTLEVAYKNTIYTKILRASGIFKHILAISFFVI